MKQLNIKVSYNKHYDINGYVTEQNIVINKKDIKKINDYIKYCHQLNKSLICDAYVEMFLKPFTPEQLQGKEALNLTQVKAIQKILKNKRVLYKNTLLNIIE